MADPAPKLGWPFDRLLTLTRAVADADARLAAAGDGTGRFAAEFDRTLTAADLEAFRDHLARVGVVLVNQLRERCPTEWRLLAWEVAQEVREEAGAAVKLYTAERDRRQALERRVERLEAMLLNLTQPVPTRPRLAATTG